MQSRKCPHRVCPYRALVLAKQSAAELSQPDAEEKKESPVAVAWQQSLTGTHAVSKSDTHASEECGIGSAVASSRNLAKTPHLDVSQTAAQEEEEGAINIDGEFEADAEVVETPSAKKRKVTSDP
jgi:hypothetical protein